MLYFVPLLLILLTSSCATIFSGTSDTITFNSKPEGASILVNGTPRGTTPATIQISRPGMGSNIVILKKEGFQDITFVMDKSFNGVSIINLGNILGWCIDAVSGALMKNSSSSYDLSLEKKRDQASRALNVEHVAFTEELEKDAQGNPIIKNPETGSLAVIDQKDNIALIFEK